MIIRLFIICVFIFSATSAWATTRYVDPLASCPGGNYSIANHNCTGSAGISYTTIAAGVAATASGDTLEIRGGTYNATMSNTIHGGTSGSPTTIEGYGTEIFTLAASSGTQTVLFDADSYVTMRRFIIDGGAGTTNNPIKVQVSSNGLVFEDCEVKNAPTASGFLIGSGSNNGVIRRCNIHDNGGTVLDHGIYIGNGTGSSGWLIENNLVHNNFAYGMQIYPIGTNFTVRGNKFYSNGAAGLIAYKSGHIIERNMVYGNAAHGIRLPSDSTGAVIRHNTVYANTGNGIYLIAGGVNHIVQNNLSVDNTGQNLFNQSTNATLTTNRITGSITDCTVSTSNFTLKSGTNPCINAGTALTGVNFNGSAPDQGAFESLVFASCVVDNGAASTMKITFTNNVFPPLLPATGMTGFTARKALVNDPIPVGGIVRTGTNQIFLTLTNPIVNGDAVDFSYVPGNVTDSSLISGSINQPLFAITNQGCTNNVGSAATHVFTQATFEFHGVRGTEAAPTGMPYAAAPENTNIWTHGGGAVRLRIAVTCTTADCPPTGFFPRFSRTASGGSPGAYTVVPDTFGLDNMRFFGVTDTSSDIPNDGTPTTDQLSTSGTFVSGAIMRTSNAIPTVDIAQNGKTELEYIFVFDTDAVANTTYDIHLYKQDGTPLTAYTVTPRITIMPCAMTVGF